MTPRWYVVHVYSGFENKVAEAIRDKARKQGLEDHIQEILVPMEEIVEVRRGQRVNAERKFFPGYVLAKLVMDDDIWHLIKNTPKVSGFLGAGGNKPVAISEAEAQHILRQVQRIFPVAHQPQDVVVDTFLPPRHQVVVGVDVTLAGFRHQVPVFDLTKDQSVSPAVTWRDAPRAEKDEGGSKTVYARRGRWPGASRTGISASGPRCGRAGASGGGWCGG
ncbi:MAG: transcription termination/antitermination protein NusG [Alphaproteobacteria bacterium PRO2]|nr:transcription termination/antitermination protein NusG [Alphaproteobacteria bacterium PRO2]